MSEVNPQDLTKIKSEEDVFGLYMNTGRRTRAGIEVELAFIDPSNMKGMSIPQNKVLKNAALAALPGDWVRNEPSSETIEVNSSAGTQEEMKDTLEDVQSKLQVITEKARGLGLRRSYFQELPDKTAFELLKSVVNLDRYQAFFVPYRADLEGFARYFTVCKSNQVSVSYSDPDHMLENVRRLYYLSPFLFMLTDNSSGFAEGQPFSGHQGMYYRSLLIQGHGGVPPYVFTANSGEEYISNHIQHVMNNPLFVYYDETGKLNKIDEPGKWTTFLELEKQGLNIASNYYLAQSMLWPDVKIAALKDEDGNVTHHRYEARMFGVGIHQHQTAFLITCALAYNEDFAKKVNALLLEYGFNMEAATTSCQLVQASYREARQHDGKFFDIPFGLGIMSDFAKSFADLLEEAYNGKGFDDELTPITDICRSGCTDAKVNRLLFPTLEDIINFQKTYPDYIFDNPCLSAKKVLHKELESSGICQTALAS